MATAPQCGKIGNHGSFVAVYSYVLCVRFLGKAGLGYEYLTRVLEMLLLKSQA